MTDRPVLVLWLAFFVRIRSRRSTNPDPHENRIRYAADPDERYQTAIRNPTSSAPVISACIALEASIPIEV